MGKQLILYLILWLFDLDETLIFPNHQRDAECLYNHINHPKLNKPTVQFFNYLLKLYPENVGILTSRPDDCRSEIQKLFPKCHKIYCNDKGFTSQMELDQWKNSGESSLILNVEKKISQMAIIKEDGHYNQLILFDDRYEIFQRYHLISQDILVLPPFYNPIN